MAGTERLYRLRKVREISEYYEVIAIPFGTADHNIERYGKLMTKPQIGETKIEVLEEFRPLTEIEVALLKSQGYARSTDTDGDD